MIFLIFQPLLLVPLRFDRLAAIVRHRAEFTGNQHFSALKEFP